MFGLLLIVGPLAVGYGAAYLNPTLPKDGGIFPMMFILTFLTAPIGMLCTIIGGVILARRDGRSQ